MNTSASKLCSRGLSTFTSKYSIIQVIYGRSKQLKIQRNPLHSSVDRLGLIRMASSKHTVDDFLEKYSTDKYYIDYQGSLSNHCSQGIIALDTLGASPSQIQEFVDHYIKRLEDPGNFRTSDEPNLKQDEAAKMLGKRQGFYQLKKYYDEIVSDDLDQAIAENYPRLYRGMIGSAVHGLIYLGYVKSVSSKTGVVEGLAYQHFNYMPLETERNLQEFKLGRGPCEILDVVSKVKASGLQKFTLEKVEQAPWATFSTGFQNKAGVLMTCKGDTLLNFVEQIKFPSNLLDDKLDLKSRATALGKYLVDVAITVYTASEKKNDFFLIHGVTSAWSLLQLLPCFKSHGDVTEATTVYLSLLLAVYVIQGCPELNVKNLENTNATSISWEDIKLKAISSLTEDEHIYKIVQVCYEMSKEEDLPLYKVASMVALENTLVF